MSRKPTKETGWARVRYGRRVLWARRAETGNWMITNTEGTELRTIAAAEFRVQYEFLDGLDDSKDR
jgi:hypothetical protein